LKQEKKLMFRESMNFLTLYLLLLLDCSWAVICEDEHRLFQQIYKDLRVGKEGRDW